jgi:aspartate aminotransferase
MSILSHSVAGYLDHASWIRRMFEAGGQLKARYGEDKVYDFSLCNPDLPAPPAVALGLRAFAAHAGEPFAFGYMPTGGFGWAREKLAAHLSKEQGVPLKADQVILGCGAAGVLNAFLRAVLDPGEEMLAFAPYFVEYGFYVANHGGTLRAVMSKKDTFAPDLEALEAAISAKTRVVLINSPNNPTGVVYSRKDLTALAELLENKSQEYGRPIWLVADEPYRFLAYDGVEVPSVLPLYPYAVVVSSFSKCLSLPGERVGYAALSPRLPEAAELMAGLTLTNRILGFVNPPVVGQHLLPPPWTARWIWPCTPRVGRPWPRC